jgi:hypothetical protein
VKLRRSWGKWLRNCVRRFRGPTCALWETLTTRIRKSRSGSRVVIYCRSAAWRSRSSALCEAAPDHMGRRLAAFASFWGSQKAGGISAARRGAGSRALAEPRNRAFSEWTIRPKQNAVSWEPNGALQRDADYGSRWITELQRVSRYLSVAVRGPA